MSKSLLPALAFGLGALGLASSALAQSAPAPLPTTSPFSVRDFGAKGDGTTKDTAAFQRALDTCAVSGGGEVIVPAGSYLIGSIQLGYHTTLRLEKGSTLSGSPDIADYPMIDVRWEGRWQPGHRGLIYAANVEQIGIVGPGTIAGAKLLLYGGDADVPAPANPPPGAPPGFRRVPGAGTNGPDGSRNPVVIEMISCNDVLWDGFTVTQGGNWATHPTYCNNVVIRHVNISGNRDGIDVDSCKNVRIEDSKINTGDDSISLKSGRGMDGARLGRACEDILITRCDLTDRSFACLGVGSEVSGGVRNVRIEHCKLNAPRSFAIYIKTRIGRAGDNRNISGDDLDLVAGSFLRINLTRGGNSSTADDPVPGLLGYPTGENFSFSNVRVTAGTLLQADEISAKKPLQGLTLSNVTGTAKKGMTIANATGVHLSGIAVTGFEGPLLGTVNVTGTGLEGAVAIPAPIDPPPGNARGGQQRPRGPRGPRPDGSTPTNLPPPPAP
jgi:polygalacturonase